MNIQSVVTDDLGCGAPGAAALADTAIGGFSGVLDAALMDARTAQSGQPQNGQTETLADADAEQAGENLDEEAQKAAAARQAALEYLNKWIVSGGAPEELERDRVASQKMVDEDGDGVPDFLQGAVPENALETFSQTIADPEDEGEIHVAVTKIDAEGKPKVTRIMRFDNGDGENRGELTPERAASKNDGRDAPKRPGAAKDGQAQADAGAVAGANSGTDKNEENAV